MTGLVLGHELGQQLPEVAVSGTASTAAAVEEQQPQEESSLLPLNRTLMNVRESTTRHDETEMAVQPAAKKNQLLAV